MRIKCVGYSLEKNVIKSTSIYTEFDPMVTPVYYVIPPCPLCRTFFKQNKFITKVSFS